MAMDKTVALTIADYVVIVLMFLIPMGIGIWFAYTDRKKTTRDEYLLGGRKMSLFPITMSLFVTYQSAISLMGIPNEVYQYGIMFPMIYIGSSLSYVVGYFIMIPVMYPLRLTSLYEYLLLRFESPAVRLFSTVLGMIQTLFYMAVALFSPALALQTAAAIPLWLSVVIVGLIGTVYTAIGGIKSVVWTDTFQTLVVFGGIFIILVTGCVSIGSVRDIWAVAYNSGRLDATVISPDPRTRLSWWGVIFGAMFMWMTNIFNQSTIQRISSMRTKREASICFFLNVPLMIVYGMSLLLVGVVMFAYFSFYQCDPIKAGILTDGNQILPFYVVHALHDLPGMSGFYMGTLFSGGLSTISSGMNALAANTVEDILKGPMHSLREKTVTLWTKFFVLIYGVIIVGLAYGASSIEGPVTQMSGSVFGACGGPIFGMFLMGLLVPWANKYGALTGGIVAIVFNVFLAITGQLYGRKPKKLPPVSTANCFSYNISRVSSSFALANTTSVDIFTSTDNSLIDTRTHEAGFFLFDISYLWYSIIGTFVSLFLGLLVSYLTRGLIKSTPRPELLLTFSRRFWSLPLDVDVMKVDLNSQDNLEMPLKMIKPTEKYRNSN
ncbi:unnamed protein product [Candidula unifasciata]|uniref:Sodium-coupled monocarboxylate transporter 1 n=1 Tax=Candidula unifasciata TaxID=100452 RepID=A0A8S4A5B4_9EUPU|nr:unnamed protein product [Candidula unifasciata]